VICFISLYFFIAFLDVGLIISNINPSITTIHITTYVTRTPCTNPSIPYSCGFKIAVFITVTNIAEPIATPTCHIVLFIDVPCGTNSRDKLFNAAIVNGLKTIVFPASEMVKNIVT